MFKEWGFLLTEIWVLLALAALLGLVAGWIIWGGRGDNGAAAEEVRRLRLSLEKERSRARASIKPAGEEAIRDVPAMQGGGYVRPTPAAAPKASNPKPFSTPPMPAAEQRQPSKPSGIDAPRDGLPDDLTKIKGVGAKLAKLCNDLGFYHYDQIAAWTEDEVAWVDDNLEGFKGRVTRDNWVAQAKELAGAGAPAFARRRD